MLNHDFINREITQREKQLVLFTGNHYVYSPYKVKSQTTKVQLPSSVVESYTKTLKPVAHHVLEQYNRRVKPAFDHYIVPSMELWMPNPYEG